MPLQGVSASQILASARTHLNDDDADLWTDPKLFPKFQEAHRQLLLELQVAGMPVINQQTVTINVPANTGVDSQGNVTPLDMSTIAGYPSDMVVPIWMKEQQPGQDFNDFTDMTECDFLPDVDLTNYLQYWCWQGNTIFLLGSLNDVNVQLRYRKTIPVPLNNSASTGVILGELFLSYKTASIAAFSTKDQRATNLQAQAKEYLDTLLRINIKQIQDMPARRRPYHRGYNSGANMALAATGNSMLVNSSGGWLTITIPSSGQTAPYLAQYNTTEYILTSNFAVPAPVLTGVVGNFFIVITQDNVGGRTVTFDSSYKGVNPAGFDTTANTSTILQFGIKGTGNYALMAPPLSYGTT